MLFKSDLRRGISLAFELELAAVMSPGDRRDENRTEAETGCQVRERRIWVVYINSVAQAFKAQISVGFVRHVGDARRQEPSVSKR